MRLRFTTRMWFAATTVAALMLAGWTVEAPIVCNAIGAAVISNLLGVAVAIFVTNVLGFPNDGSPPWGDDEHADDGTAAAW